MTLLVLGTLAYDLIETAYDRRENVLGGSATYCSVAASHFCPTRLVGVVGKDFAREDIEVLEEHEVDTKGLEFADGETFRWGGRYEADWNIRHTLYTHLNVLESFDPKVPQEYRDSRFVFLANTAPALQSRALDQLTNPEFVMADTMNLWIDIAREDLDALVARVDAIVLNDEEARMLTGETNLISAAREVLQRGPRLVVVKKGEHGAFLVGEEQLFSVPAYPVEKVVDPTGAGDSFAGGFMGHLASKDCTDPATLREAMMHGTVAASFCVQGFGVRPLAGRTPEELAGRYVDLLRMVTV